MIKQLVTMHLPNEVDSLNNWPGEGNFGDFSGCLLDAGLDKLFFLVCKNLVSDKSRNRHYIAWNSL